jgi:hypothetical protein
MAADSLADGPPPPTPSHYSLSVLIPLLPLPTPSHNSPPPTPFPLLQGTRLSAKREKALSLRREELLARSALLVEMARYSSSPECSLTVRALCDCDCDCDCDCECSLTVRALAERL